LKLKFKKMASAAAPPPPPLVPESEIKIKINDGEEQKTEKREQEEEGEEEVKKMKNMENEKEKQKKEQPVLPQELQGFTHFGPWRVGPGQELDGVLCINLASRTDRRAQMIAWAQQEQLPVHFLDATAMPSNPVLGCRLSHRRCIEYARDCGWRRVLVLEDDVYSLISPLRERLPPKLPTIEFYLAFLGAVPVDLPNGWNQPEPGWMLFSGWCGHAYVVSDSAYSLLLGQLDKLDHQQQQETTKPIDELYHDIGLQYLKSFLCWPMALGQRAGRSDIDQREKWANGQWERLSLGLPAQLD
jgi:hypothetical protein